MYRAIPHAYYVYIVYFIHTETKFQNLFYNAAFDEFEKKAYESSRIIVYSVRKLLMSPSRPSSSLQRSERRGRAERRRARQLKLERTVCARISLAFANK